MQIKTLKKSILAGTQIVDLYDDGNHFYKIDGNYIPTDFNNFNHPEFISMQIKVHVTLQELKNFYIAGFADFPKDAELVVDEDILGTDGSITTGTAYPHTGGGACRPGCAVYHPPIVETPNYYTTESFGRQIQH